jgi:hypothetical protein
MRRFMRLIALLALAASVAAGLAACSGGAGGAASPAASASPSASGGVPFPGAGAAKLAPGLYDLKDDSVVAVGAVEHRDLEGGFWAVIGGTQAAGQAGKVVAVIANGDDFAPLFKANKASSFLVYGRRAGDASTRMAGPEITARRVVLSSKAGPAD